MNRKILVGQVEAAEMLDMGRRTFREKVMPNIRVIREGRRTYIPVSELEDWASRRAEWL